MSVETQHSHDLGLPSAAQLESVAAQQRDSQCFDADEGPGEYASTTEDSWASFSGSGALIDSPSRLRGKSDPGRSAEGASPGGAPWPAWGRVLWAVDASDEMLVHWLCPRSFRHQRPTLDAQRAHGCVKWNPVYGLAWLVTLLSLWLGREGHRLVHQGGPVSAEERREEYEVRVHWVYTTTGAMLWVFVRSLVSLVCAAARPGGAAVDWAGVLVTWVVVAAYCASNAMLLRVLHLRSMVGTRAIIVFNGVFALCMLASLVSFCLATYRDTGGDDDEPEDEEEEDDTSNLYLAYVIFEKATAVVFFLLATAVYCRAWSLYRWSGRNWQRRALEVVPSACAAGVMLVLMYLGLVYHGHEFQPYFWATFTR